MASPAIHTRPGEVPSNDTHNAPNSRRSIRALVISPQWEIRQHLLRALEALPADVTACSTRAQAEEVLAKQAFEIVFCDEHLPDGSFEQLIQANHYDHRIPRVVVTTRTGEWDLYFVALAKGAFDVIRCPWYATDVEMTVIRALRDENRPAASHDLV